MSHECGTDHAVQQMIHTARNAEANRIVPRIDPREFDLLQINNAMQLAAGGHINGKVIVRFHITHPHKPEHTGARSQRIGRLCQTIYKA